MENMVSSPANPNAEFWQGKTVLVTGHTGFKGAWLSLWLSHLGANVTGFSLPDQPSDPCLSALTTGDNVTSITGDLRDPKAVQSAIQQTNPEIIFHLAAQSLVRDSYDDPVGTYATNVMGTLHLLEAARKTGGVKTFINVTSDKCYENTNQHQKAYREDAPMGGHDPYSSSKGCAELLTSSYRRSYLQGADTMALASVRAGNVIGGGDWANDRIVPDCMRAFSNGETVTIRNPRATRPWQHVLDPLSGYMVLAEKLSNPKTRDDYAQGWNFGPAPEDAQDVEYIVSRLVSLWGDNAKWELDKNAHPHEAKYLEIDASKAKQKLSWQRRLPVADALQWTAEWYKPFYNGDDAKTLCLKQINDYENLNTHNKKAA